MPPQRSVPHSPAVTRAPVAAWRATPAPWRSAHLGRRADRQGSAPAYASVPHRLWVHAEPVGHLRRGSPRLQPRAKRLGEPVPLRLAERIECPEPALAELVDEPLVRQQPELDQAFLAERHLAVANDPGPAQRQRPPRPAQRLRGIGERDAEPDRRAPPGQRGLQCRAAARFHLAGQEEMRLSAAEIGQRIRWQYRCTPWARLDRDECDVVRYLPADQFGEFGDGLRGRRWALQDEAQQAVPPLLLRLRRASL